MALEPDNGGARDETKIVTIRVFATREAAQIAAASLESTGILCWIAADDAGGMMPNLSTPGGVRLSVRAADTETAVALLNSQALTEVGDEAPTSSVASHSQIPTRHGSKPIPFMIGIVLGVVLCLTFQYWERLGTRSYSHASNGVRSDRWIYRNGHLAEHWMDRNLDGKWDSWAYHDNGNIVRTEEDNNFDGKPDETWFYSNGDLVRMEKDRDFNGVPDEFCTYKYHIVQTLEIRPNGSKSPTLFEIFSNGILTEARYRVDSNRIFNSVVRYDPFMNPISTNEKTAFELTLPNPK